MLSARLGEGPLADKMSGKASYAAASGKITLDLESPHLGEAWAASFAAPLPAATDRHTRSTPALASRLWTGAASYGRTCAST